MGGLRAAALLGLLAGAAPQQPQPPPPPPPGQAQPIYVASVIIPRIQQELECFLVTPFDEVIVLAQAEVALRLLDVSTFNEAPLREELYKHTLATGAKGSPNAGESARSPPLAASVR